MRYVGRRGSGLQFDSLLPHKAGIVRRYHQLRRLANTRAVTAPEIIAISTIRVGLPIA